MSKINREDNPFAVNNQKEGTLFLNIEACMEALRKLDTKIDRTHDAMLQIVPHIQHLSKLDTLEDIRDTLLEAATGRNHIDANMATLVFKILGAVILTLLFVLLFLLTGQHFNILTLFKGN